MPRAYNIVRDHFAFLAAIVRSHDGAVVKTIGDAVMAAFGDPAEAVKAALAIQADIATFNATREKALVVKLGVHTGGSVIVNLNERLDYFGSTVNMAARLQGQSEGGDIVLSRAVADDPAVKPLLAAVPTRDESVSLKGFDRPIGFVRVLAKACRGVTTGIVVLSGRLMMRAIGEMVTKSNAFISFKKALPKVTGPLWTAGFQPAVRRRGNDRNRWSGLVGRKMPKRSFNNANLSRYFSVCLTGRGSGSEVGGQRGGGLVVGLEALFQETREREEAVDRAGIVHVGRLDARIDQPLGIGAALVAQRIVARGQHEGGREACEVARQQRRQAEVGKVGPGGT